MATYREGGWVFTVTSVEKGRYEVHVGKPVAGYVGGEWQEEKEVKNHTSITVLATTPKKAFEAARTRLAPILALSKDPGTSGLGDEDDEDEEDVSREFGRTTVRYEVTKLSLDREPTPNVSIFRSGNVVAVVDRGRKRVLINLSMAFHGRDVELPTGMISFTVDAPARRMYAGRAEEVSDANLARWAIEDFVKRAARADPRFHAALRQAARWGRDGIALTRWVPTQFHGLAGRGGGLTVSEIEDWIDNDEGLYNWWKMVGGSKRAFIKKYRAEIEEAIEAMTSGKKRQHYLEYDKPKKPPGGWNGLGAPEDDLLSRLDTLITRAENESKARRRDHSVEAIRAAGNLFIAVEEVIEQTGAKPSPELTTAMRHMAERLKNAAGSVGVPLPPLSIYRLRKPLMHGFGAHDTPDRMGEAHWFQSGDLFISVSYRGKRDPDPDDKAGRPRWKLRCDVYRRSEKGDALYTGMTKVWHPERTLGFAEALRAAAKKTVQDSVEEGYAEIDETALRSNVPVRYVQRPRRVIDAPQLQGFGADIPGDPPDKPRMVSLKSLLPADALDSIERRHNAGLLTIRELKDICHRYSAHLDSKGVDPTYLAYFIAHALGLRR